MIMDRVCHTCGKHFKGGPRAWYCPECRHKRQLDRQAEYRAHGYARPLGSTATCERCGKPYTVIGGLQRFCPKCGEINGKEKDRELSLDFYYKNKDTINPKRNERRRIGLAKCVICGKEFDANHTCRNTCSEKCHAELVKQNQRRADAKRSPRKKAGSGSGK